MSPQTQPTPPSNAQNRDPSEAKPDWAKSDRELGRDLRRRAGQKAKRRLWPWAIGALVLIGAGLGYGYYTTQTAAPPTEVETPRLYVGNLSYDATEQDLEELFKGFDSVREIEIDYESGPNAAASRSASPSRRR